MKNNITELVFILDRSGSMSGLEDDAVGGFNSTLENQKAQDGKVYVSTVLFDNFSEVIHDRIDINEIQPMTRSDYYVHGCTALFDAVGDAIRHIANIHKYARPEDVPEYTIFCIMTDGMENASYKYSRDNIKEKINHQIQKYGWEFIFLAANIDAFEAAEHIGIPRNHVANWSHSPSGMELCHDAMNFAITNARTNCSDTTNLDEYIKEKQNKQ